MKIKLNTKHKISTLLFAFAAVSGVLAITPQAQALDCGILPQSICSGAESDPTDKNGDGKVDEKDTGLWALLLLVINIMTAGVGLLAVGGIIYGAVMYTSAGGNQDQVKKARGILTNVVVGVIAFAAMYALLQWLIPGGVF